MRIGVLGGGQLGRMLALAGYPLGLRFVFLDPAPSAPAGQVGDLIVGAYDDPDALDELARQADAVTFEFENVPAASPGRLLGQVPVYPPPLALEVAQDRLKEKTLFRELGIPVPRFVPLDSSRELLDAIRGVGLPAVLKTRRLGYDGKGQVTIREEEEAAGAWKALGGVPAILEQNVGFDREVSIVAARGGRGEEVFYPVVENHHRAGILRLTIAPAPGLEQPLQRRAEEFARRVLDRLDYVGVLAIELFQCGDELMANEMACRVHNSGHWSIDGAETSQFENHVRAVAGLPLGPCGARELTAMVNLIGVVPRPSAVLALPGCHLHLYGKSPLPGRKLGHVNVRADSPGELKDRLLRCAELAGLEPETVGLVR